MSFTSPLNWLWLPALAGAIVLLWLHRPRREEIVVPSLRLWRGLATQDNADPARRFLRRHLLLFLQLLTAFLLVSALARPFLFGRALAGQRYVLVVDNSASMQATDVRPSRMEAARDRAAQFVAHRLRPEDTALVLQTSPRAQALCRLTNDPARLRAALAQVAPTDAPGDMAEALTLAQSITQGKPGAHLQIYSDGLSAAPSNPVSLAPGPGARQVLVGTEHPDNIGITSLDAQPASAGTQTVFVSLRQAGQNAHPGLTLSLSEDGRLLDARQPAWTRGAAQAEFAVPVSETPQVVTVRLEHCADDLTSDNSASLVLAPAHKTRVLLVSAGSLFLERGLASLPNTQVSEVAPTPFAARPALAARADVVVLDGDFPLGTLPPGRFLTFGRAGLPTPFTFTPQPPADVAVVAQSSAHPVMRFVDMHDMRVRSAVGTQVAGWGQALAAGSRGPLVAAGEANGSRVVSVAFGLSDSDLPLRVAFPLFLASSLAWLAEGSVPGTVQPDYAAGQTAQVALPPGARAFQILRPDGTARTLSAPPAGGTVAFGDTSQVGVYTVLGPGGARYPLAVNLLSAAASGLAPRQAAALNHSAPSGASTVMHRVRRDWWMVAAGLALLLLAAEWWVYHRRA